MSRLAEDIELLARAARIAGIAIYPEPDNVVRAYTLDELADKLAQRRGMPAEYMLIGDEAVMLMQAARNLVLHRDDKNMVKAERWQRLAELFRAAVEMDLANARKSLGEIG